MKKIFILLTFIFTFSLNIIQINGASSSSSSDAQIDIQDLNRQLIEASKINNINEVERLIEAGAQVNARDMENNTPLHWAAIAGNTDITQLLIARGAEINARNANGDTPLQLTGLLGTPGCAEVAQYLRSTIENLNRKLFQAVRNRDLNEVQRLIEKGAQLNALNADSYTPLHYAVNQRNIDMVKLLIEVNADVNAQARNGNTPLHRAVARYDVDIAQALIDAGADINIKNRNGFTPLHYAVVQGNINIVKMLISKDANVNTHSIDGRTPLHTVAKHANPNVILLARMLLTAGADVNTKDNRDQTPINLAQGEVQQFLQNIINIEQQLENLTSEDSIESILDQIEPISNKYNQNFIITTIIKRLILQDKFNLVNRSVKARPSLKSVLQNDSEALEKYKEFLARIMQEKLWQKQHQGIFADVEIVI